MARILVIEDNPDVLNLLTKLMQMWGHEYKTTDSGRNGIALTQTYKPDIVILDIGLPDIDGYEVARQIRDQGCRALLVGVSGYPAAEMQLFDCYIIKPVSFSQLKDILDKKEC